MHRDFPVTTARPSLRGALAHMAELCWAIWLDHREHARQYRRARRLDRAYRVSPSGWKHDACHLGVAAGTALAAVALALHMAGAWGPLLQLLGWAS